MNKKQSIGFCALLLTSVFAQANIGGTIYKDIPLNGTNTNTYGTKDSNEKGVAGIAVTAYDSDNNVVDTTNSSTDGTWTLVSNEKVRVEFTNIPTYLKETAGQSSVQFVNDDTSTVDLALYNPSEYALSDKNNIAMTLQPSATIQEGVSIKVLDKEDIPSSDNNTVPETVNTPVLETGSVWGLAYDNKNDTFYTATVIRRHTTIGPNGLGAIYKKVKDANATLFTTVENVGTIPSNTERNLTTQENHDPVFNQVGRMGLGDIDISADGTKLYTINLNTNALIEIDIKTKIQTEHNITNPFTSCTDVKSWGIGQHNGKVYVGSVCTTDTAQGAYISEFDGATFTPFHNIPLAMEGENSLDVGQPGRTLANNKRWGTWITDPAELFNGTDLRSSLPAPILSDIIFDEDDNIMIGFIDRTALQTGTNNLSPVSTDNNVYKYDSAGDIYKVCHTTSGYKNEGETGCNQNDTDAVAPAYPEFFVDEEWNGDVSNSARHKEIALGGLAYLQGSKSLVSSAFDPTSLDATTYNTSGLIWMNTTDGTKQAGQRIVGGQHDLTYNGKSGGIGDIEILTPAAPTEIGNRVWFDENANCVQDANESGISGVVINLYESSDCTGLVAETNTTTEDGLYSFMVNSGTTYSVCIDGIDNQAPLDDKKLTCNDKGTALNNSDAINVDNDAQITVAPLTTGANDHALDFGFTNKEATVTEPVTVVVVTPSPTDTNRTVDTVEDDTCDCNSYTEDSTPALSVWSMILLMTLTSFMAFLFRKELNQVIK